MSLQLILGGSGFGKTTELYRDLIDDHEKKCIAVVPEQFTMETQRTIVNMSTGHGTMNIDILSFDRLAKRLFDESSMNVLKVLDDTGKCLILRKIVEENKDKLCYFKSKVKLPGFIEEVKSMVSEFYQYGIGSKEIEEIIAGEADMEKKPILRAKLKDMIVIMESLNEYLKDRFVMNEELLTRMCELLPNSEFIRDSIITFDEYTGFSPVQYEVIGELLKYAKEVRVAICIRNPKNANYSYNGKYDIFALPKDTISRLKKMAEKSGVEIKKDIILTENCRCENRQELRHLEENIFKYNSKVMTIGENKAQKSTTKDISVHVCETAVSEIEFVASQIRGLVSGSEIDTIEGNTIERNISQETTGMNEVNGTIIEKKVLRYKDIAVICADMEIYRRDIEKSFYKYDIPYFMDYKRSIITNPCVETIRAVLEIISDNFSYESVFRYLKSGMSTLGRNQIDKLENYVLMRGIKGAKKWFLCFEPNSENIDNDEIKKIKEIEEARKCFISDIEIIYGEFKEKRKNTVGFFIDSLKRFCERLEMESKLEKLREGFEKAGNLSMAKEYSQVYEKIMELFEKTEFLIENEMINVKDLSAILDSGFQEIKVGVIPQVLDSVQVGDIERTRLKDVKVLFLVGANEGSIPKAASNAGILSGQEREFLSERKVELSPTARENSFIQKYYLYLCLTKMSEKLFISFRKINGDGSSARQSYLVNNVADLYDKMEVCTEREGTYIDNKRIVNNSTAERYAAPAIRDFITETMQPEEKEKLRILLQALEDRGVDIDRLISAATYELKNTKLEKAVAKVLYGDNFTNNVTRLETYAACAYKHFLNYGLNIVPRKEYEIKSSDIGTLYHETIEKYSKKVVKEPGGFREISEERQKSLVDECVKEVARDKMGEIFSENARNTFLLERIKRMALKTVWVLGEQVKAGSFEPGDFEMRFSPKVLDILNYEYGEKGRMGIQGTIDRVDYMTDGDNVYVKIIDYKSGSKKFEINDVYNGLQMQLVIYMEAALESAKKKYKGKNAVPAGIFYYNIDNPYIDVSSIDDNAYLSEELREDAIKELVQNESLKGLKVNGIVNDSDFIIQNMDKSLEGRKGTSSVIPVAYLKSGEFSKNSSQVNEGEFNEVIKFVHRKIGQLGEEILDGKKDISPYIKLKASGEMGQEKPCNYCEFKSVCGFDKMIKGYEYRKLEKCDKKEILDKMRENGLDLKKKMEGLENE